MTIELASAHTVQKPWGVPNMRPWSEAASGGASMGEIIYERPGRTVLAPALLLKILLTSQPLSIQVHPNDDTAHAMGLPNGKTEAWYILGAKPDAKVAVGLKQSMTKLQLRAAINDGSIAEHVAWRGVTTGDVIVVPAGTIHAIGAGLVIAEIQQRSDTTFRLFDYGRSRELQVERALVAAHTEPAELQLWPDRLTDERSLLVDNPHFIFERIELLPGSAWYLHATTETWLLVIAGSASTGTVSVITGNALFVESDRVELRAGAQGVVALVAYVGAGGPAVDLLQRVTVDFSMAVQDPPLPRRLQLLAKSSSSPSYGDTRP